MLCQGESTQFSSLLWHSREALVLPGMLLYSSVELGSPDLGQLMHAAEWAPYRGLQCSSSMVRLSRLGQARHPTEGFPYREYPLFRRRKASFQDLIWLHQRNGALKRSSRQY